MACENGGAVPTHLEEVGEGLRVEERFSWAIGSAGAFLCLFACGPFVSQACSAYRPMQEDYLFAVASAVAGVALVVYEVRRRRRRAVLIPWQGRVALYERGRLLCVRRHGELTVFQWNSQFLWYLAAAGLVGSMLAFGHLGGREPVAEKVYYVGGLGMPLAAWWLSEWWKRTRLTRIEVLLDPVGERVVLVDRRAPQELESVAGMAR